jgi:glycosyltransferase involved in cell wall biosynthesis
MSTSTVMLVRPTTGGVAHVASRVAAELRRQGRPVIDVALAEPAAPAWRGLFAALRLAGRIRRAGTVHVELGRTTAAPFWFALVAVTLRRDVVVVAHDAPVLVDAPGAAVVPARPGWRDAIAHRVFARLLDQPLIGYVRRRAGAVGVLSRAAAQRCRADGIVHVGLINHGADPPVARPSPSRSRAVVFGGFLSPAKGLDDLLAAWQRAGQPAGFELLIAGTPSRQHADWVARLTASTRDWANPPRWLGYLDDEAFDRVIGTAAVVVLPYRSSNPCSGILIRAMVQGRAVVATRVAAMEALIDDGVTARLVDPRDPDGLARALTPLLADPHERDRLGARAARVAAARHTWRRQVADLDGVYSLAGRRS